MKNYGKNEVKNMPPKKWRSISVRKPIYDSLKKIAEQKNMSVTELVENILLQKLKEVDTI